METSKTGYQVQSYNVPVKRYCQTLDLRDSPELIAEYRKRHSETEAWPEILAGIREVGILEMEIYILGTRLFMIVETPVDFDWDTAMARHDATQHHSPPPTGMGRIHGYIPASRSRNEFRRKMETDGKNVPLI